MTVKEMAAKLRKTADMLDELVGFNFDKSKETVKTAEKIKRKISAKTRKSLLKNLAKARAAKAVKNG